MEKQISAPIDKKTAEELTAGDYVYITGTIYTARDAAHKRMKETLDRGEALPFDIKGQMIYYMGSSGKRRTSDRISRNEKGKRSREVLDAVVRNKAVYFAAVGGAGALLSKCIQSSEVIAYEDLGTEAVRKLYVKDFPVIVVADSKGNNLYETAIEQYRKA